jgi:hypothetical protein
MTTYDAWAESIRQLEGPARVRESHELARLIDKGGFDMSEHQTGLRVYDHTKSQWAVAAEKYLLEALDDVRSGYDAIPAAGRALDALRIEQGELPPDPDLLETGEEE